METSPLKKIKVKRKEGKEMLILETKIGDVTLEQILQFGLPILFGCAIISLIFYALAKHKRDAEDNAQPILEENAKVIDKQQVAPNTIAFETWVMFETESGRRVRLICKPNNVYIIGDEGCLRWQGSRLYSFERGKSAPKRVTSPSCSYGAAAAPQDGVPAWKRIEMMEKQQEGQKDTKQIKCVFCGQLLQEGQVFCGACGRRRD